MEKKRIVFLYTEIATYFLACIEKLALQPNVEITVIRWPLNKEAPFNFSFSPSIAFYTRNDFTADEKLIEFVEKLNPSILYCSGWLDKGYLKVCKKYKNKIPVIVGFDNQWMGSLKQQVARIVSPFKILNHFSYCWVPGILQEVYALKLGFRKENILTGFYSCDFDFFYNQYLENKTEKQKNFPKRFIYVGRYYEFKGIKNLWTAFIELQNEFPNEWELWCLGNGDIIPVAHPKIKHFGFVQPNELLTYIKNAGVFVLPSFFEPWGVVVHEYAAAGFPIICSDKVGARTAFVENNYNGYIYKSDSIAELKAAMTKIIKSDASQLNSMSERSVIKAKTITPETWSQQLMKLIK
ncbi:MAG TPA: glycosyltransferase [Bacteroidia bacterium]|nr:glycosyltransferase [Bacteroidia bacterium]